MPTPSRKVALERLLHDLGPQLERGSQSSAAASRGARPVRDTEVLCTGIPDLDNLLKGGISKDCISEVFGDASSGRTYLAFHLLAGVTRKGELAAWIDASDSFAPDSAAGFGVELSRLLWVRAPQPKAALRCAEAILQRAGFGLVVLDFTLQETSAQRRLAQLPTAAWLRLRRAAAKNRTPLLLLVRHSLAGSAASLALGMRTRQLLSCSLPTAICGIESELYTHRSPGAPARQQLILSRSSLPAAHIQPRPSSRATLGCPDDLSA